MGVGKTQSSRRERVDVGSVDQATVTTVTVDITDSQVISKNENDVRFFGVGDRR